MSAPYASTRNACKMCSPLGACIAYRGIEGCIPLVHGSQGCSTYIRRYAISHFREPLDVASSNFTESSAIFGGKENLERALANVLRQYGPKAIGVSSTCLSETIGEDVPAYLREIGSSPDSPVVFSASTPSYRGTHMDGFHEAVYGVVRRLAAGSGVGEGRVNLLSGFVSCEDLRELHAILRSFGAPYTLLPDYSDSLDGGAWAEYQRLPEGGTSLDDIRRMADAAGTVCLGKAVHAERNAASFLQSSFGVGAEFVELPVGIANTDAFMAALSGVTGSPMDGSWRKARGRLIDAYVDGHKYCFGKRAVVYGDEDFACAIASFLGEVGIEPVIVATGAASARFRERVALSLPSARRPPLVMDDADFETILERAKGLAPDFVIGNGKGLYLSRNLGIPIVRVGFPIHDRIGGHRILHLGYRGTLNLFDLVCNALMQESQVRAKSGYTYI